MPNTAKKKLQVPKKCALILARAGHVTELGAQICIAQGVKAGVIQHAPQGDFDVLHVFDRVWLLDVDPHVVQAVGVGLDINRQWPAGALGQNITSLLTLGVNPDA